MCLASIYFALLELNFGALVRIINKSSNNKSCLIIPALLNLIQLQISKYTMISRQKQLPRGKSSIPKHQLQINLKLQQESKKIIRNHASNFQFWAEKQNSKSNYKELNLKQTSRPEKQKTKRKVEASHNQKVISSSAYQTLYCRYLKVKNQQASEQMKAKQEVLKMSEAIGGEKRKLLNALMLRDKLMQDLNRMSQQYNQLRINNYHIHCQIYANEGQIESHYYQSQPELAYEEMLRLQEQMGVVEAGYLPAKLAQLPAITFSGEEQKDCCICCCEISKGQMIAEAACQHVLHHQCLLRWLQFKKTCPLCRQQIVIP